MRYSAQNALQIVTNGNASDHRASLCEAIACFSYEGFSIKKIADIMNVCKIPPLSNKAKKWGYGSVRKALVEYVKNNPL